MISRRWKTVFALLALVTFITSAWVGCACFSAAGRAANGIPPDVLDNLVRFGVLHVLSCVLLLFALYMYMRSRRNAGLDLLFVSIYALLIISWQYVSSVSSTSPSLTVQLMGLYSLILSSLPMLGLIHCQQPRGTRRFLLLMVPVDAAALLPVVFALTSQPLQQASYFIAFSTAILAALYCLARCLRRLKRGGAFVCIGLAVGLLALLGTLVGDLAFRLATGSESHAVFYGLVVLLAGLFVDVARPIAGIEAKLNDLQVISQREEEYRFASRHMKMFIIRYQVDTKRAQFRPDTALTFGLPQVMENMPESLIAMGRAVETTLPSLREMYARIQRGDKSGSAVFGICKNDGSPIWLHTDFTTSFDAEGNPEDSIISSYEIVGLREKEAAYEKWLQSYRELTQKELSACYEVDLTRGEIRLDVGDLLPDVPVSVKGDMDALARHIADSYISEDDREAFLRLLDRDRLLSCYEQDTRYEVLECRRQVNNSEGLWTQVSVRMISDPYSNDVLSFVLLKDIEEQKRREARDRIRAQTDELTGLLSRVSFIEQLNELCLASGMESCHAVLMIDLDGFKAVNDTFGHRFGDKVLADVAGDLRAINRSDDLIARLGGDEFILCLKNVPTDTDFLATRCREICSALSKQYGDDVAISGSVGVAIYPSDGRTFDELYAHADQAQYSAKQLGRNRFVFYNKEQSALYGTRSLQLSPAVEPSRETVREADDVRHTLLLVDDQRVNRALMRKIFEQDYDVLEASGGREALGVLQSSQHTISAVILDLIMPEVSGLDVLRAMNEDAYYQSIPVIVISGADESEYSVKAIKLGAADFVSKPIDPQLVLLRVRNAILRRESENLRSQNRDLMVQRADETRHQNQLRYLADHDTLTHICNKNAFYRKTRDMIRRRPDMRFCIVSFDVQRFRAVNDIFGHDEGDRLLRFVAMQMRNVIGQDGTFTRADTDNFAFCVEYDREKVEADIQALIDAMTQYDLNFEVLLSFGVYVIDDAELPVNQMYDRSEMAKRTVKGSYVKRMAYYDDHMRAVLLEEQEIVNSMHAALEQNEFVVYYQPKCMLDTGLIVGAEALVRWKHGERGLLNPALFIPIFEKNGFIMQLDVYMWEQVCRYLSKRLASDPDDQLHVSVNISRASLYNPTLSRTMNELCKKYNVPVERMEVEITESAYVENAHLLREFIDELHRLGFTVEMDDFGSGYSSLNMLKEIPVDVLKLDMRFLLGVQGDDRGGSILSSTLSMAHQLHLQVIAEGVETEEQARFLASIGCKQAQGFYYAAPMPESDFTAHYDGQPTIDTLVLSTLEEANAEINRLLCSAAVCERTPDGVLLTNANDYYLHMMRIERVTFDAVDAQLSNWIGTEDMKTIEEAMDKARATGRVTECVYLQRDLSDRFHLLRASVRYLCGKEPSLCYLVTLTDISSE